MHLPYTRNQNKFHLLPHYFNPSDFPHHFSVTLLRITWVTPTHSSTPTISTQSFGSHRVGVFWFTSTKKWNQKIVNQKLNEEKYIFGMRIFRSYWWSFEQRNFCEIDNEIFSHSQGQIDNYIFNSTHKKRSQSLQKQ